MRKITLALAMALAFAGSAVVTADAQTTRGANNIAGAVENFTPIQPAAADGGPIAGRDSCARAAGFAAGVAPAGDSDCKGEARSAASPFV